MIPKESIDNSIQELRVLIDKMEAVLDSAPPGALIFKRYPNNERVPFLSIGSRKTRRTSRVDPADKQFLAQMEKKALARRSLPELRKALGALESAHAYEPVNLYRIAAEMGPEFRPCADHFLGKKPRPKANPAFDCLQDYQNPYQFGKNAITTDIGIFRTKGESLDATIMRDLGIEFKYEVSILVGTQLINVDFVVNLYWKQQIGIIEHHGLLDDHKYRRRKMDNLETMMNHGIYPGQNLLILSESPEYGYDAALAKKLIAAFCLP